MAYVSDGTIKSKAALARAVAGGAKLEVFSPGAGLGGPYAGRTKVLIEGPHYPMAHTMYALVDVDAAGFVSKVHK